ncbi:MAG: LysM peptidoglycan-binding domain-containing protein [Chloroflexi bacterium]|nr:LysM peptidoglycan-binding domain-containing protein [Chloroflexota bacterium]
MLTVDILARNTAASPTAVAIAPTQSSAAAPTIAPSTNPAQASTTAPSALPPADTNVPGSELIYEIKPGDTLGAIAQDNNVSIDDILRANPEIANPDSIVPGQKIRIPVSAGSVTAPPPQATPVAPLTTAAPTAVAPAPDLPRSILEGDLASSYPLALSGPRVTIHYQRGSFTDVNGPPMILNYAEQTLAYIEQTLGVQYVGPLDVYFAGSLFLAPDQALRGRAYSTQRKLFVLYDGSGTPAERRYMLAHEMTHVVAWNTLGAPSSVMLSEGLATYVGQVYLDQSGFIAYKDFCRALSVAGRLPSLTAIEKSGQDFLGHIRTLYNYNTAACFTGFLLERKNVSALGQLYPKSSYTNLYGAGLGQLQSDFERDLAASASQIKFDPNRLVQLYDEVRAGYDELFNNTNPDLAVYGVLDRARIAVVTGKFDEARSLLDQFNQMVK